MDKDQKKFFRKFGSEIRKIRINKGMTLEDMQEYDFSPQHFQKIESGKKAVNFYTVFRIAKALGINLANLVKSIE